MSAFANLHGCFGQSCRLHTSFSKSFSSTTSASDLVRLNKRMRDLGLCSRREADEYIRTGSVMVNNCIVRTLGALVRLEDDVKLCSSAAEQQCQRLTIALNKPRGFISQAINARPRQRFSWQLLTWENQAKRCKYNRIGSSLKYGKGGEKEPLSLSKLGCCGRLDVDSTGLLLFTQDGRIARSIIGKKHKADSKILRKYYEVECKIVEHLDSRISQQTPRPPRTFKKIAANFDDWDCHRPLRTLSLSGRLEQSIAIDKRLDWLRHGLSLDGDLLRPADVKLLELAFTGKQEIAKKYSGGNVRFKIALCEGKYHQIRRMCKLVGMEVISIHRTGIGGLTLEGLDIHTRPGLWTVLSKSDIGRLHT